MKVDIQGLYEKFRVIHMKSGDRVYEPLFVLLPEKDTSARHALISYANHVKSQNEKLSSDIIQWIDNMPFAPVLDKDGITKICPHCGNAVEPAGTDCVSDGYYGIWTHYDLWYCHVCDGVVWEETTYPPDFFSDSDV